MKILRLLVVVLMASLMGVGQAVSGANQVQGTVPTGQATQGNPIYICGLNAGNCVAVSVDSAGKLNAVTSNFPATVDTNNGAAGASTLRVTLATNSAGPVFVTNLPSTVDTNSGVVGASTIRTVLATNVGLPAGTSNIGGIGSAAIPGDGAGTTISTVNSNGTALYVAGGLFNNSSYDRARSGDAANLPNLLGSTLVAPVTVDPCQSPSIAKSSKAVNITSATTTNVVAVSGSTNIYVCGGSFTIDVSGTSKATFLFEEGTGGTCGSNTVVRTGAWSGESLTATDAAVPVVIPSGMTAFSTSVAARELCILTAGTTVSLQGYFTFVQR